MSNKYARSRNVSKFDFIYTDGGPKYQLEDKLKSLSQM